MPKISIIANVPEEVYDNVVVPTKAEKRFSRLVVSLLQSYFESDTVRAIVDGVEAHETLTGIATLQEKLNQAHQSIDYLGMLGETLSFQAEEAKDDFTQVQEEVSSPPSFDFESFREEMLGEMRGMFQEFVAALPTPANVGIEVPPSPRNFMDEGKGTNPGVLGEGTQSQPNTRGIDNLSSANKVQQPPLETPNWLQEEKESVSAPLMEDENLNLFASTEEPETPSQEGTDVLNSLLGSDNSFSFGGL